MHTHMRTHRDVSTFGLPNSQAHGRNMLILKGRGDEGASPSPGQFAHPHLAASPPLPRPPGIRRFHLHTEQDSSVPLRKFLQSGPETMARLPRELGARLALAAGEGEGRGHCQAFPAGQRLFIPSSWPCPAQVRCHPPLKTAPPSPPPPTM